MPALTDLLETLASRGEPAGADVVVARARAMVAAIPVTETIEPRRRARRARRASLVIVAVAAVVAIVVPVAVLRRSAHEPASSLQTHVSTPGTVVLPEVAPATAAQLATFRWSTVASPPTDMEIGTATWDGHELIIFGPGNTSEHRGVAAAYDPTSNRWRRLPPSPLVEVETDWISAVWTGRQLVVAQGDHATTIGRVVMSSYDPLANRWRAYAAQMMCAGVKPTLTWTGTIVVVTTGDRLQGEACGGAAPNAAHGFDPVSGRWSSLPELPLQPGEYLDTVSTTRALGGVVALMRWVRSDTTAPGTTTPSTAPGSTTTVATPSGASTGHNLHWGERALLLAAGAQQWTPVPHVVLRGMATPFGDDARLVVPPRVEQCPFGAFCGGSLGTEVGFVANRDGSTVPLAATGGDPYVAPDLVAFTGDALVAVVRPDTTIPDCVAATCSEPRAVAWDLTSGHFVALASPAVGSFDAVWTGRELIAFAPEKTPSGGNAVVAVRLGP